MSERPEPDMDHVREAMRERDERTAEDETGEPPGSSGHDDDREEEDDGD